jgi:hypothetical protein
MAGNDSFTKILLHFDGADASTTITDTNRGGSAHTWTANGNGQLDTAIKKFGTAALLCDGTGDYVSTPDHADFTLGSGDWTVDFWFNVGGGAGTTRRAYGQADSANSLPSASVGGLLTTADVMNGTVCAGGVVTSVIGTTAFTSAGWHHYAFVRTGNILKLFLDGVQEGGDVAFASTVNNSTNVWSVGRRGEVVANSWFGSIDEFRLSVGTARWTSNFTPPAVPYGIDVSALSGSYAVTGSTASLKRSTLFAASSESYAVTGTSANLLLSRKLTAVSGSYAVTGSAVTLAFAGFGAFQLVADSGSYTVAGSDAGLRKTRLLDVEPGSYAITGSDVSFRYTYLIGATAGTYTVNGSTVDLIQRPEETAIAAELPVFGSWTLKVDTLTPIPLRVPSQTAAMPSRASFRTLPLAVIASQSIPLRVRQRFSTA